MPAILRQQRGGLVLSDDPALLQVEVIHAFLTSAYWSRGIPRTVLERAIQHSLCLGVYDNGRQVAFARAITDRATFAYLADVFVQESHRRLGVATWLVRSFLLHPELQGLRRWMLVTADAQELYRSAGFQPVSRPERYMEIHRPHVYEAESATTAADSKESPVAEPTRD
jgi:GNAT superfamily N-acetyltransferase